MAALEQRTATLDLGEACARCGVPVGAPPPPTAGPSGGAVPQLYLFPTGAAHARLGGSAYTLCSRPVRAWAARVVHAAEAGCASGGCLPCMTSAATH